jgi:putative ABC transport system permease protein
MKTILTSTVRNFRRKPVTSLINLLGLSVSLALVIILSAYCYSQLTTDHFHKNGDRVYLYSDVNNLPGIYTPGILKEHINLNIPGVESVVRMSGTWDAPVFQAVGKEPITSDLLFVDPDFFKFFTYRVIEGDPESALKKPLSAVITGKMAEKLFGKESAVGKTIKLNNDQELTIHSVVEEPDENTCISFSVLTSMATRKIVLPIEGEFAVWDMCLFQTFVLLKKDIHPDEVAKGIASLFPKEMQKEKPAAHLTPLKELYFSPFSLFMNNYLQFGDQKKVLILLLVAALVLMIALINFINISATQWIEKINQTGVMKVIGASRSLVLRRILSDSFVFFLISLIAAILLCNIYAPTILDYAGIRFDPHLLYSPAFFAISVACTFALSMLFSLIPAWRISSSKTADNLKKNVTPRTGNSFYMGILVTSQFIIAIVLIAFTVLVQKQVNFGSSNLGIQMENVIGIKLTPELYAKRDVLIKLLTDKPAVITTSFSQYFPGEMLSHWTTQTEEMGEKKQLDYDFFFAGAGFLETMGLKLTMGRFFSADLSTDGNKVVVNERFVHENKLLKPIGAKFSGMNGGAYEIIGVVKDFHYKPFSKPIVSLAILNEPNATSYCLASLKTKDYKAMHQSVQEINTAVSSLSPSFPVEVRFLDQAIQNLYRSELLFRRAFSLFSACALVICCLGILAMSLLACQCRTKEIGIRRVNGAGVFEIMVMLNKDFIKWVFMAFFLGCPIAWYAMHQWLENFAYKTGLSWWVFAGAGLAAVIVALLTISWQSWRVATRNPVEALRYE